MAIHCKYQIFRQCRRCNMDKSDNRRNWLISPALNTQIVSLTRSRRNNIPIHEICEFGWLWWYYWSYCVRKRALPALDERKMVADGEKNLNLRALLRMNKCTLEVRTRRCYCGPGREGLLSPDQKTSPY